MNNYGRMYTVPFSTVAVTAQQDLFEITAATARMLIIHGLYLYNLTEVGDAQEEMLSILLKSGQTVSGSGGTSVTPVATDPLDSAASFVAEANNTTKANTGTIVTQHPMSWNVRVEREFIWTPAQMLFISAARRFTVELATTPADSITMSGVLYCEEIG